MYQTIVSFDDTCDSRQSEAGAFLRWFGCEEWFKNAFYVTGFYASAFISQTN